VSEEEKFVITGEGLHGNLCLLQLQKSKKGGKGKLTWPIR